MAIQSDNLRGALLMMACMGAFIINDTLIKLSSSNLDVYQAIFLRGCFATTLIILLCWQRGVLFYKVPKQDIALVFLRSLGELGATFCFITALFKMDIANTTAILQAAPLAIALGASIFLGEKIGWRRYSAIIIGFIGVLIIVRPGMEGFNSYSLFALGAVMFVAARDLLTRRLSGPVPSLYVAMITAVMITTTSGVISLFSEWPEITAAPVQFLAIASLFLIVGYITAVAAMRVGEIGYVSAFRYSIMIWAIIVGILVFNEMPDRLTLIGSALIVAAGLYTFYRERKLG